MISEQKIFFIIPEYSLSEDYQRRFDFIALRKP